MMRRQAGNGVAAFAAAIALYALFAGQISASEAYAAGPLALATGAYAFALARVSDRQMRLGSKAFGVLLRGGGALVPDTVRVGRVLASAIRRGTAAASGMIADQPFRVGGASPDDAGRRAACMLALSLAPNGFALYAVGDDALAMHRLAPPPAADREWPA